MELISVEAQDGMELTALYSRADGAKVTIVHVHGYGGDFYSHPFLHVMHRNFPADGISFVSLGMRTSGYVQERYTDGGVEYVGSSLVEPDAALLDVEAMVATLAGDGSDLVLQGHSFGTNVVRIFALNYPSVTGTIFLAPGDSVELQRTYDAHKGAAVSSSLMSADDLRWDLFGVVVGDSPYPIPITSGTFHRMITGAVFPAWSPGGIPLHTPSLVIQGSDDLITQYGNTRSYQELAGLLPNLSLVHIPGARHTFRGYEQHLCSQVGRWVKSMAR